MNIKSYFQDRLYFIVIQSSAIFFVCFMMGVLRMSSYAVFYVALILVSANVVSIFVEFIKKYSFYKFVRESLEKLDKKYFISELISKPSFSEGEFLYEILKIATKSMNDQIGQYKIASEEYREYIETWVHEIKTPISAGKLIIENNKNEITQSLDDELTKIEAFVEQALFYSKSNNVEKDYIIKEVRLSEIIKCVVKKHSKALIESRTSVELGKLDNIVYADHKWLDFIFGQIITNSIKYRREELKIKFYAEEQDNKTILTIEDNGVGICEKDLGRVFDKGFTGENGRKFAKSTGMGLYLCKKLCTKMGLGMVLTSAENEGTKVSFIFPQDKSIIIGS